jgi:hypothetical protein
MKCPLRALEARSMNAYLVRTWQDGELRFSACRHFALYRDVDTA